MLWRPSKLLGHHEKSGPDRVVVCGVLDSAQGAVFPLGKASVPNHTGSGNDGQVCALRRKSADQRKHSDQRQLLLLQRSSA